MCARLLLLALLGALGIAGCATSRNDALLAASAFGAADEDRLIVVTVHNSTAPAPPQPGSSRRGYTGGAYAASDAAQRTMQALAREFQLTPLAAWPIAALNVHCAVFRIPAGASRDALLQQLMRDQRVQLAQQMNGFVSRSSTYNDPYVNMQRGFLGIDAESAQQWSRGERVRVAVIDTGVDAKHPDFGGRISVQRNFVDHDLLQFERDRHGTAVAGVISASADNRVGIVGVAPAVQIIALKACWQLAAGSDAAHCNSFTLAQALAAAIEERVQIVNLSLTGPPDPLLNSLVLAGSRRGILYVGAAPSDSGSDGFPRAAAAVIPVDMAEPGHAQKGVLLAPGNDIVTLTPGGSYDFVSGTSLATAHVTGTIALLLAMAPRLDRASVYALLSNSQQGTGVPGTVSINACNAIVSLLKHGNCAGLKAASSVSPAPSGAAH